MEQFARMSDRKLIELSAGNEIQGFTVGADQLGRGSTIKLKSRNSTFVYFLFADNALLFAKKVRSASRSLKWSGDGRNDSPEMLPGDWEVGSRAIGANLLRAMHDKAVWVVSDQNFTTTVLQFPPALLLQLADILWDLYRRKARTDSSRLH